MDIISYVQALIAAGTPIAYACLGILGFFVLYVLWELLHGLRRGFARQITHTIFMLAAAVLAFLAANGLSSFIFGGLGEMTMEELLTSIESSGAEIPEEVRGLITSFDLKTLQYLLALPLSTVVIPLLFSGLFVIINALLKIVSFIVCTVAGIRKKRGPFRRIGGLLVGAAEGALVAAIILLPFAGIASSLRGAVDTIREDNANPEIITMYDENIAPIVENPVFALINSCGGEAIMTHFATVPIDGEPMDLRHELVSGIKIYLEAAKLSGVDMKDLSASDKSAIDALIDAIGDSDYVMSLVAGVLRGVAYSVDNEHLQIEAEPPFNKMIDPTLKVFESCNKDNLVGDLNTVKDVIFILSDEGVFTAIDSGNSTAVSNAFTREDENGKTVVRKITDILNQNEHTKILVSTITEISVAILCETMDLEGDTAELYDNVRGGIKNTLDTVKSDDYETEEEYVEALSSSLNQTLLENDINLEPEIVDSMAEYIKDNHKDLDDASPEEVDDIILSYYDSYLEHKQNNPGDGDNAN